MSKELFVSSTPHETKVAIVEEDQLTEVYFERENEYTLAGSIYKGRVTRVLPGMQSAFVNIGLERDAFLYVSDFILEEDEDAETLEHVTPRPYVISSGTEDRSEAHAEGPVAPIEAESIIPTYRVEDEDEPSHAAPGEGAQNGGQRGSDKDGPRRWKGRRRRGRGRDRFADRAQDRPHDVASKDDSAGREPAEVGHLEDDHVEEEHGAEFHEAEHEPVESAQESRPVESFHQPRPQTFPSHQPMVLPGESISKYQPQSAQPSSKSDPVPHRTPAPAASSAGRPSTEYSLDPSKFLPHSMVLPGESISKYRGAEPREAVSVAEQPRVVEEVVEEIEHFEPGQPEAPESSVTAAAVIEHGSNPVDHSYIAPPLAETAPPVEEESAPLAGAAPVEEQAEQAEHLHPAIEERHHREEPHLSSAFEAAAVETEDIQEQAAEIADRHSQPSVQPPRSAGSGVMEEEEIEEEEGDLPGFAEHLEVDELEMTEELEEEEMAQFDLGSEITEAVRDAHTAERVTGQYESEGLETSEEFEEMSEAFGPAGETVSEEEWESEAPEEIEEGSAELRAPVPTAGYQQRVDRRSGDRRGGGRKGGGRRMKGRPRPHTHRPLPAITDLLKEGQEILVQIAKEPIAKKGARITSHIALPGRYLVYMPTVHHTGVSRKIASEEERQRLKRIVLSERGDAHGGFIVRTAAASASEEDLRADIRFLINLWTEIRNREIGRAHV